MKKVCSAEKMRSIDLCASSEGAIPSIVLMENAAIACVNAIERDFSNLKGKRVMIFCGRGNNGGDGFAIARHLINKEISTRIFLVCGTQFSGDTQTNYDILRRMGANIVEVTDANAISCYIWAADIVIDAIYGTGARGEIGGVAHDVIKAINRFSKYTLSVDIPSGLHADTGKLCGICVKASKTVTFAAYKTGMFMFPGADYTGDVELADISIPQYIIEKQDIKTNVIDIDLVKSIFPVREKNSHKGDYGKVFIVAGSKGMTGAAYLAAQAALYSGSGLVTLGIPESLNAVMENKLTEVMTLPLEDEDGNLSYFAAERIIEKMNSCDVLLFGPGLGRSDEMVDILKKILSQSKIPVIVDADGLNALAKDMSILDDCSCGLILTPHTVEFSRLAEFEPEYIEENRLSASESFAKDYGLTLILKGAHTIVTAFDGEQYINTTGNAGMASGGSGDVLAGMIAAFAARGLCEKDAAVLAVYLHGRAGDMAADRLGMESVTAQAIIDFIPYAIKSVFSE
ncbi:MAG: NAD(P)H-hydrate dehydratase [Clostridia bacterium]|nr:NAD(P)H-hydrate dehydratase [Clostridia bacterium]